MRFFGAVTLFGLLWLATACSTNRGGTSAYYNQSIGSGEGHPVPTASPSQRPGMTPEDPRDPQFITRPQPLEAPPTTKP